MPKFRSMRINTLKLPTHLLSNPEAYLTPIGSFIRRSSFVQFRVLADRWMLSFQRLGFQLRFQVTWKM
jgi:hypothetical protein